GGGVDHLVCVERIEPGIAREPVAGEVARQRLAEARIGERDQAGAELARGVVVEVEGERAAVPGAGTRLLAGGLQGAARLVAEAAALSPERGVAEQQQRAPLLRVVG